MDSNIEDTLRAGLDPGQLFPLIGGSNGPTAEAYAEGCMSIIFFLGGGAPQSAYALRYQIIDSLTAHFATIIEAETNGLAWHEDRPIQPYDAKLITELADNAIADAHRLAHGTEWESHVTGAEWTDAARDIIGNHLATAIHVLRLCFADRSPDNPTAQAYKARFFDRTN